jgi:hypothetical protein
MTTITFGAGITVGAGVTLGASGGGGGGGPQTYTAGVDYTNAGGPPYGAIVTTSGGFQIQFRTSQWTDPTDVTSVIAAYPLGTSITITVNGESPYTTTTTSAFTENDMIPGLWFATMTQGSPMAYPNGNVNTFTIG